MDVASPTPAPIKIGQIANRCGDTFHAFAAEASHYTDIRFTAANAKCSPSGTMFGTPKRNGSNQAKGQP
jgi:hypothetical protein